MLKNIIITSLRNFFRNKSFSLINLIGLSVSMSLGMLIIMIIQDQLSFDSFHKDSDRVYRINTQLLHPDWGNIDFASTPLPLGEVLKNDYSLTENTVRINSELYGDVTYKNITVPVRGLFVDPSFLEVFNFPLEQGSSTTALQGPNSLILTQQSAEKVFGPIDPIGQTLTIGKLGIFTVTGVLQELPGKTHFEFEVLCSTEALQSLEKSKVVSSTIDNWSAYYNNYVYIKLKDGSELSEVEKALSEINKKYCVGLQSDGKQISYSFYVQPLDKITPGPELSGQMGRGLPAFFLLFLSVLGIVVLLMSIFNFTNLTIAKSLSRAREIGVRKVVGANRYQVFFQFIGEAVVFSLIALVFSYILLQFLKGAFLDLSLQEDFFISLSENISLYVAFTFLAVIVGILAGVLPAIYLSAFKPSKVLKDVQNLKVYSRLTFRKVLMVVQFTLTVIFVIVVSVVYQQIDYMVSSDYGIQQKNNLNLSLKGVPFEKIANEIRNIPGVVRVGGVSHKLGTFADGSDDYKRSKDDKTIVVRHFMVDNHYIDNLALNFLAGHNFLEEEQTGREREVILNETALAQLGFEQPVDALGETIYAGDTLLLRVIGVVKDFHFRPMNNKIGPMALRYNTNAINYLSAHIESSQKESIIQSMQTIWKKFDAVHPMEYAMMEDEIDDAYRQSGMSDVLVILGYITFLIISLSCLGMLGMAMYAAQVRVKEVGIRKVMGASVMDVVLLLSKSFMILIGIAILIGVPVSYFAGTAFLEGFAYKIEITPTLLAMAIVLIAGLGLVIVWSQTIKVATSNPTKWLRND
ncbi:MAG: ABC transporter permease [Cyclobacteriaceae bacterium]|nr:ABC transporter permease [Cyclobacteriaceae bacterium]